MIRAQRLGIVVLAGLLFSGAAPAGKTSPATLATSARRISLDEDWRFLKGDAKGAEDPAFDDSQWRSLNLPHDWAIEGPFDPNLNPHTGALPIFGTGWYRKSFLLSAGDRERRFTIVFDGAMSNSKVWLNGHELGGRPYGYASFSFDLTPYLHFGAEPNVLAVRLTPEDHSSRWYPGAGIYRNVWLDVTGPVHVATWGTYVTTPEISDEKATVAVKTDVVNSLKREASVVLRTSVVDQAGKTVATANTEATSISPETSRTISSNLTVPKPQRWDVDHPYLYTLVSEVLDGGRAVDRYSTPFGIRTIAFDREKGFLLNGRKHKLHGVCLHHDLGALGAAVNRRAIERQLQIMKDAGVNAIRTSHNPPAPELLDYCDRLGLVVMDEAFDMWRIAKVQNDYSKYYGDWSERDVRDMARRDRNHPSIIMWSIGNEIPEQKSADGWKEARRLTDLFHEEDPTRPTTSNMNEWPDPVRNHFAENIDLAGFSYKPMHYEEVMKEHPNWIVFGSETASCVSSRGVYHLPLEKYEKHPSHQISSYDIISPPWAYCPDVEFFYQDKFPNVLGEFVWTGFDYIGEPTPYFDWRSSGSEDWPAHSSYFGMVDLAGFPKDRFYLYQSQWTTTPMVHILPHWNWAGHEGQPIPVMAYTNAEEVELFLNGKSLGKKKRFSEPFDIPVGANVSSDRRFTTKYRLRWDVPYEPGSLKAVAYSNGKQVAQQEIRTAGAPARVVLVPDRAVIRADGEDLSFVTARVEDKDGNLCPMADNLLHFKVTGAGKIEAVDNGNAATVEPFQADQRSAFSGLALLIVRPGKSAGS
ncbi:MAG TPA: beta-galactosidase GalB, partial [Terriglobales bacterium]|nr:beta-galactosidase GalB [Terriglobales bacterium]